jgi:hypothetical protein
MKKETAVHVDILVQQLQELRELHEHLLLVVRGKQRAMRSGDMNSLASWSAREQVLIERIQIVDKNRQAETQELGKALGLGQTLTLTALANQFEEPERSQLLALAAAIRSTAEQIYQINQVNDAVTREILNCFAQMQRQITAAHCDIGLYDPNGRKQLGSHLNILDAVG